MKIMIISDTHRQLGYFLDAYEKEKPIDMLFHCGDITGDGPALEEILGPETACAVVAGNCDSPFDGLPLERNFELCGHRVHMEHGFWPPASTTRFVRKAKELGADIVLYGHTHRPEVACHEGVWVVNPGSISSPRQADGLHTYVILNVSDDGELSFELKNV